MAERRMFAKTIVFSDAFIDMPFSARSLYVALAMLADDDGFVNNPKSVVRQVEASQKDLDLLIEKRFVLSFNSGVIAIKHWKIHNYIQKDRYKETKYAEEKSTLTLDENGAYTERTQDVSRLDTQVRLGKGSLGKDSLGETTTESAPTLSEVYMYFRSCMDEDYITEAEKFHAYNANRGWDCLPDWKATADLWIARIGEHRR